MGPSGQRSTHMFMDEDAWSQWRYVFLMFTRGGARGSAPHLTPGDLCLMLESRGCECTGEQAIRAGRTWGMRIDDQRIDEDEWLDGLRKVMAPDGKARQVSEKGEAIATVDGVDIGRFVNSMRAYTPSLYPLHALWTYFGLFLAFPLLYTGLRGTRCSSPLFFAYRYLVPSSLHVHAFHARGGLTILGVALVHGALLVGAPVCFVCLVLRAHAALPAVEEGVRTGSLSADAALALRHGAGEYYSKCWSEGACTVGTARTRLLARRLGTTSARVPVAADPLVLLVFCALVASIAFVRQQVP